MDISEINNLTKSEFCTKFSNVVEHHVEASEYVEQQRPFQSTLDLIQKFNDYLENASADAKEMVLKLHPDLAGRLLETKNLTPESLSEQQAAGLDKLTPEEKGLMNKLNTEYKEKFGFPFIIVARENKANAILNGLQTRLQNTRQDEIVAGINQVKGICRLRILNIVKQ
uniref:2-oxo-4-hydroxy-4-carboxy-5-ureidoimidazoline decarboxylase n=1 Tax=Xenopsylla cheopis TaxID=163159 RepID=A0A6M2DV33_XENCH